MEDNSKPEKGSLFYQMVGEENDKEAESLGSSRPRWHWPKILQELENELVDGLTMLLSESFSSSKVPDNLGDGNVTPSFRRELSGTP